MDNVHALRDTYKADMVQLVYNNPRSSPGIAYMMTTVSPSFASSAFSVIRYTAMTRGFVHELGHNLGCDHDRVAAGTSTGAYSYSYGYISPTNSWRTIMANTACGGGCAYIRYWSNPNITYAGEALGSAIGNADEADNATTINNTKLTAANWRVALAPVPATITSPTGGSTFTSTSQTFTWTDTGATYYSLWLGSSSGASDIYGFGVTHTGTSFTVTGLPTDGRVIYARLYTYAEGAWLTPADYGYYAWTAAGAGITSPTSGSTFSGTSQTFSWNDAGASNYSLWIGDAGTGSSNVYGYGISQTGTSVTVTGLPTDGRALFVRLYSYISGNWYAKDYGYYAWTPVGAGLTSPASGSTLSGSSQTFRWNNVGATYYSLWIGSSGTGSSNIYGYGVTHTGTSVTVTGLPTDGRALFVRLYSYISGSWYVKDYGYYAWKPAVLSSPSNGSTLSSGGATFSWTNVNATYYSLWLGSNAGGSDLYGYGVSQTSTSVTLSGLPVDGSTIYIKLWTYKGGSWYSNSYSVNAWTASGAVIYSPAGGSTISGGGGTLFKWNDVGATNYSLWIGTSQGRSDIYGYGVSQTGIFVTVSSLPTDGSIIWARLYSYINGTWFARDHAYYSGP